MVIDVPGEEEEPSQIPRPGFWPNWLAGHLLKSDGLEGSSEGRESGPGERLGNLSRDWSGENLSPCTP